jgi:DNA repair protein RadA/Sms
LAVALALVSSLTGQPLSAELVACGEVGLGGELRQVSQTPRRLAEAARLGFHQAVVPASTPDPPAGITLLRAATLADAVRLVGLLPVPGTGASARRNGRSASAAGPLGRAAS